MVYRYSGYKFSCAAVAKGTKYPDKIQKSAKDNPAAWQGCK